MHICKTVAPIWQEQKQIHIKHIRMVMQGGGGEMEAGMRIKDNKKIRQEGP